jgi:hypothetical protein
MGQSERKICLSRRYTNAGRTFAEGLCGRALRNWKSTLNTEFVQKGKDARDVYGNIPLAVWEEFVDQKKTTEGVALSVQQKEKAMKAAENPIAWVREDMLPKWQNGGRRKKKGG